MSSLPKTLPYHLFEEIRKGIIRGKYLPGTSLREQELEAEFGSSRGPVRESLRLLELKGLAVHSPRKGFRVRDYTDKTLVDIYHMRAALECMVVDALRHRPTESLARDLRRTVDLLNLHNKAEDLERYFEENMRFHELMIEAADNEPLQRVLGIINEMSLPIRYFMMSRKFPERRSLRYHHQIATALAKGDFDSAKDLTRRQILASLDHIRESYLPHVETARAALQHGRAGRRRARA